MKKQNTRCEQRLRELIDADLPPDELERLARVDALLRLAAVSSAVAAGFRRGVRESDRVNGDTIRARAHAAGFPGVRPG